jgi:uncharacterized protein (TIGR03067 family)
MVLEDPSRGLNPDQHKRLEVYRNRQPYREGADTSPKPATADIPPPSAKPAGADQNLLTGKWVCILTLKDGEPVDNYVGVRAVIDADNLTWFFPEQDGTVREQKSKFRIDPEKNPKEFDWWQPEKAESKDLRIFTVNEKLLRWATNLDGKTRPATFDSAKWQFTMKRMAASTDKP